jgi:RNA polymerase sigma-70 factor, ECF subfamily
MSAKLRLLPASPTEAPTSGAPTPETLRDLHARRARAERWLLETHTSRVERILFRILGDARLIEDLTQEVFARVFVRIEDVREPGSLKAFVTSVTVNVAREAIRKRRRHRWLAFFAHDEVPDVGTGDDTDAREALLAFYRVLDRLDPDERIAFVLRFVDGADLSAVAAACGVSLATIKRRLQRAEAVFVERCKKDEALCAWIEEGSRWA